LITTSPFTFVTISASSGQRFYTALTGASVTEQLVLQAGVLFVWAATAARFIRSGSIFANDRLQEIRGRACSNLTPQRSLDRIYLTVLDKAAGNEYGDAQRAELGTAMLIVIVNMAA
jgi:hypothetical protein